MGMCNAGRVAKVATIGIDLWEKGASPVRPFSCHLFCAKEDGRYAFFCVLEDEVGRHHVFACTPKSARKLRKVVEKQA